MLFLALKFLVQLVVTFSRFTIKNNNINSSHHLIRVDEYKLVREYLTSSEGQDWLNRNSDLLSDIKSHITDMLPLSTEHIKIILKHFPEFVVKVTAYRFLAKDRKTFSSLVWDFELPNLSWSRHPQAYHSVLHSLTITNKRVYVYESEVKGLQTGPFTCAWRAEIAFKSSHLSSGWLRIWTPIQDKSLIIIENLFCRFGSKPTQGGQFKRIKPKGIY